MQRKITSAALGHKQTSKKLIQSKAFINNFLDHISDAFAALDTNDRFIYLNKQAEKLFKKKKSELLGKNIFKAFEQIYETTIPEQVKLAKKKKKPLSFEVHFEKSHLWFYVHIYPLSHGLSIYFTDITKQKKIIEQLTTSEKRFLDLADTAPVMLWITDSSKQTTYVNRRWLEFTGKKIADELGFGWIQGVHPDDKTNVLREFKLFF